MNQITQENPPALLLVDDEPNTLVLLRQLFQRDFPVLTASSGEEALPLLDSNHIGVIVADQRMTGIAGTDLLAQVANRQPDVMRILLTAYADIDTLADAINAGHIYRYVSKPWDNREIGLLVRSAMETYVLRRRNLSLLDENARLIEDLRQANTRLEIENFSLRKEVHRAYQLDHIIGVSPAMKNVMSVVEKAIASSTTVLIAGETGTGKEVIARAIHYNGSRRNGRFVAQNCGSMPESLLESELFGHVRGAFTGAVKEHHGLFEEAHDGTIFLDEIGDMPAAMQVKLLRVLEDGEIRRVGGTDTIKVDVRVISASHKNLKEEAEAGRFRRDLLYRLDVFRIHIPPLRERSGDVVLLARHFLQKYREKARKRVPGLTEAAMEALCNYDFPGNVRELENEIERAVALVNEGELIDTPLLSTDVTSAPFRPLALDDDPGAEADGPLRQRVLDFERRLIIDELKRHNHNRTHTAAHLGISVRALQKKIVQLRIRD